MYLKCVIITARQLRIIAPTILLRIHSPHYESEKTYIEAVLVGIVQYHLNDFEFTQQATFGQKVGIFSIPIASSIQLSNLVLSTIDLCTSYAYLPKFVFVLINLGFAQ